MGQEAVVGSPGCCPRGAGWLGRAVGIAWQGPQVLSRGQATAHGGRAKAQEGLAAQGTQSLRWPHQGQLVPVESRVELGRRQMWPAGAVSAGARELAGAEAASWGPAAPQQGPRGLGAGLYPQVLGGRGAGRETKWSEGTQVRGDGEKPAARLWPGEDGAGETARARPPPAVSSRLARHPAGAAPPPCTAVSPACSRLGPVPGPSVRTRGLTASALWPPTPGTGVSQATTTRGLLRAASQGPCSPDRRPGPQPPSNLSLRPDAGAWPSRFSLRARGTSHLTDGYH